MAQRSGRHTPLLSARRRQRMISLMGRWLVTAVVIVVTSKVAFSFREKVLMLAHEAREQHQAIAALREETERLRQQNAELREQIRRLHTPSGIILEARKQGYGFPGEKLLVLPPSEPDTR
ncbi:MAG: septum formation initiator family protein [Armatimonadota bacterium]|nr:septum formation initiator family protein [bacterium]MDW8290240.1 septum formation initiator family protein [Armatimonadota bacterium]